VAVKVGAAPNHHGRFSNGSNTLCEIFLRRRTLQIRWGLYAALADPSNRELFYG